MNVFPQIEYDGDNKSIVVTNRHVTDINEDEHLVNKRGGGETHLSQQ